MSGRLGMAVDRTSVRAVVVRRGRVCWAAKAEYVGHSDLGEVLARLAAERPTGVRTVRVAVDVPLSQCRTIGGLPRLTRRELAQHIALSPKRFFLHNGSRLVTDASPVGHRWRNGNGAALIAAAPEPIVDAIADGVRAAGMRLVALAPTALWRTSNGNALMVTDGVDHGATFAAACAAATGPTPELSLLPSSHRARVRSDERRSARRWAYACAVSIVMAGASYWAALARQLARAETELATLAAPLERALLERRDGLLAREAVAFLTTGAGSPSEQGRLLAAVARALPDSAFLTSLRLSDRGAGTLSGLAVRATGIPAALERIAGVTEASLNGSLSREIVAGRPMDRFSLAIKFERR